MQKKSKTKNQESTTSTTDFGSELFALGAAYYPDYIPKNSLSRIADGSIRKLTTNERLHEDFLRMQRQGIHLIRMGEFSWSTVEPIRNHFEPEIFHKALEEAHRSNIKVIFCTPTTTPTGDS